jgi:hypothetical protein
VRTAAPDIRPLLSNWISTNLPNRLVPTPRPSQYMSASDTQNNPRLPSRNNHTSLHDCACQVHTHNSTYLELSLRTVLAFPKASRSGLDCTSSQPEERQVSTRTNPPSSVSSTPRHHVFLLTPVLHTTFLCGGYHTYYSYVPSTSWRGTGEPSTVYN